MEKIGFCGGGQLARMMLPTAHQWGCETWVLDGKEAPSGRVAHHHVVGDFRCRETVARFAQANHVTCEIEAVSADGLEALEREGINVQPSSSILRLIQDKGLQKAFFQKHCFPTSAYRLVDSGQQVQGPGVLKKRRGGYDGQGVALLSPGDRAPAGFDQPCVWEEKVTIEKEVSLLVARNAHGAVAYDPIEMVFDPALNLIAYTIAPANLPERLVASAKALALALVDQLDYHGLMAVELFLSDQEEWLVNELAPRPHNSGHHTIESTVTSQFEQHLRAVLGLPLGSTEMRVPCSLTYNLLGSSGEVGPAQFAGWQELLRYPDCSFHHYGKLETRPGRKMGHVTITGESREALLTRYEKVQSCIEVISSKSASSWEAVAT